MNILYTEYHYSLYFVGSMLFYYAYFVTNSLLTTFNRKYRHLSNEKQMYVVSNLLKSIFLCFSSPLAGYVLYDTMYLRNWNNPLIKNLGVFYSIPDTVSLLMVKKMDMTTKIHHIIVVLFNIASISNNYSTNNILRFLIIYGCFSTFAFIVNFILAVRFLHENKLIEMWLSRIAFITYTLCCTINWGWHIIYIPELYNNCESQMCSYSIYIYSSMVGALVIDDIKLNKWLYNKSNFLVLKTH